MKVKVTWQKKMRTKACTKTKVSHNKEVTATNIQTRRASAFSQQILQSQWKKESTVCLRVTAVLSQMQTHYVPKRWLFSKLIGGVSRMQSKHNSCRCLLFYFATWNTITTYIFLPWTLMTQSPQKCHTILNIPWLNNTRNIGLWSCSRDSLVDKARNLTATWRSSFDG